MTAFRTALVVMAPEADPVVGEWREKDDPAAAEGDPAHVSVLYPFLDTDRIDDGVLGELAELLGTHAAFGVRFEESARWPEVPPYGGKFDTDPFDVLSNPTTYPPCECARCVPHAAY